MVLPNCITHSRLAYDLIDVKVSVVRAASSCILSVETMALSMLNSCRCWITCIRALEIDVKLIQLVTPHCLAYCAIIFGYETFGIKG